MEWVIVESTWIEARGRIKEQWRTLTDDDLDAIAGRRDALQTKLQERLRVTPQEAHRQVTEWESHNRDLFEETAEQVKPYLGIAKQ
jgi:uncharacterized protein YjbJ (UPF0337 family)